MEILIHSDAAKVKPGQKGNLILVASPKKPAKPGRPPVTLPAVPFEVVEP